MTEFELLTLLNQTGESFTALMQWWAGVSLALMVVAHFAGNQLKAPFVAAILFLYTSFTVMIQLLLYQRAADMVSAQSALRSVEGLSVIGAAKLDYSDPLLLPVMMISFWGTYLAATGYLAWRFAQARRHRAESA